MTGMTAAVTPASFNIPIVNEIKEVGDAPKLSHHRPVTIPTRAQQKFLGSQPMDSLKHQSYGSNVVCYHTTIGAASEQ
uniref:Uncharacterized protein n=1 Tax=Romanomermis culicivorax TaxID=13658 RepID=A0A915JFW9_ROMCU